MKRFDRFAAYGEPLMFMVLGFLLVLCIGSMSRDFIAFMKPHILWIAVVLGVLSTIGFLLNTRYIELQRLKRQADFDAMVKRHDRLLGKK